MIRRKVKWIQQESQKDCGAACLAMICHYYGHIAPLAKYVDLTKVGANGSSIADILDGAKSIGMKAKALNGSYAELLVAVKEHKINTPFVAHTLMENGLLHYIVVTNIQERRVKILDPSKGEMTISSLDFCKVWTGNVITIFPEEHFECKREKSIFKDMFLFLLSKNKLQIIKILLLSIFITILEMCGTYIFPLIVEYANAKKMYINILMNNSVESLHLAIVAIGIIILYCLVGSANAFRGRIIVDFSCDIEQYLSMRYYQHTVNLPLTFHENIKTGELLSRIQDIDKIREAFAEMTVTLVFDTFVACVSFGVLYALSPRLLFFTAIVLVFYAGIIILYRKKIKQSQELILRQDTEVTAYYKEILDGVKTLKIRNSEPIVIHRLKTMLNKKICSVRRGSVIAIGQNVFVEMVTSIGIALVLIIGVVEVIAGRIQLGELLMYNALVNFLIAPITNILNIQVLLQTATVALERLNSIFYRKVDDYKGMYNGIVNGKIEIKDLSFEYGQNDFILNDINMEIRPHKKYAIIGESGSGKSTIANLIMGLYKYEKGTIELDDIKVENWDRECICNNVIYVSQDFSIFSDTIYNNLVCEKNMPTDEMFAEICEECMVQQFVSEFPQGYSTILEEGGTNLSTGQKQKLAIARALLQQPKVLILDESTSNLDVVSEERILRTIEKLDCTCIMITHRYPVVKQCDYIYVMKNGSIVAQGTHDKLLNESEYFRMFLNNNWIRN